LSTVDERDLLLDEWEILLDERFTSEGLNLPLGDAPRLLLSLASISSVMLSISLEVIK
jgi:hypothetical protein